MRFWFAQTDRLWHLLWLVPVIMFVLLWGRRYAGLQKMIRSPRLSSDLTENVSKRRRWWRQVSLLVALALIGMALLRPQALPGERILRAATSRDLLFVLDVSQSMLAKDVDRISRLAQGHAVIRDVATRFPNARTGLVAFAGNAYVQCPMTFNRGSFYMILEDTDTRIIPLGGSNLEVAMEETLRALGAAEGPHRAVVLISDGEELQGDVSQPLAQLRDLRVPIHAVGVGDPKFGSFIQLPDRSFVEHDGQRVRTRLHELPLQAIARASGGRYVHSTAKASDVDILASALEDLVPRTDQATVSSERPRELFQWFLLAALLLLLARLGVTDHRSEIQRGLAVMVIALLSPGVHAEDDGLKTLQQSLEKAKRTEQQMELLYNIARNLQGAGRELEAISHYDAALAYPVEHRLVRGRALLNLGVLEHQGARRQIKSAPEMAVERLGKAIRHYLGALRWQVDDATTLENLALARHDLTIAHANLKLQEELNQGLDAARQQTRAAYDQQHRANSPDAARGLQEQAHAATEKARERVQALLPIARKLARHERPTQAEVELRLATEIQKQLLIRPGEEKLVVLEHLARALVLLGGEPPEDPDRQNGTSPPDQGQEPEQVPPETANILRILKAAEDAEKDLKEAMRGDHDDYRKSDAEHRNW